uniref:Secreted protein n=1 Tax=Caenorhabditis japonica TaxID=281687 RepID=A0A8R1INY7_CAEJA
MLLLFLFFYLRGAAAALLHSFICVGLFPLFLPVVVEEGAEAEEEEEEKPLDFPINCGVEGAAAAAASAER